MRRSLVRQTRLRAGQGPHRSVAERQSRLAVDQVLRVRRFESCPAYSLVASSSGQSTRLLTGRLGDRGPRDQLLVPGETAHHSGLLTRTFPVRIRGDQLADDPPGHPPAGGEATTGRGHRRTYVPVAQRQSGRLLTAWAEVRVLPGTPWGCRSVRPDRSVVSREDAGSNPASPVRGHRQAVKPPAFQAGDRGFESHWPFFTCRPVAQGQRTWL